MSIQIIGVFEMGKENYVFADTNNNVAIVNTSIEATDIFVNNQNDALIVAEGVKFITNFGVDSFALHFSSVFDE